MLTDDTWAQIVGRLDTRDKMVMERTCRRFNVLLKHPPIRGTWGTVDLAVPNAREGSDICRVCEWVQQRLTGISAICLRDSGPDLLQRDGTVKMWHALVASTLGTDIRLRLRFEAPSWRSEPTDSMRLLSPHSSQELVQRLTALDLCVAHAGEVAVVHSLAALRHLRLWTHTGYARGMFVMQPGAAAPPCQLSGLRTLQLYDLWPWAFFSPGTAASLQQLRSLCLHHCDIAADGGGPAAPQLPEEMLRLPTLERLELSEMPLLAMPNLRHLSALRTLVVVNGPEVDSLQGVGSAEDISAAAVRDTLGGATALTELCLIDTPVASRERADAIDRLPHLRVLSLDFWSDEVTAFWAATLQRRLRGRCHVRPATHHVFLDCRLRDWAAGDW